MSPGRRLCILALYICAIQLRGSMGGNPRDSAHLSARNASNSARNSTTNTVACQEDVLDQCPPNASCDKGQCVCLYGYKLNPAYHGKNASQTSQGPNTNVAYSSYCLLDDSSSKKTPSDGGTSNSSGSSADGGSEVDSGRHEGQLPQHEPVAAHHILGGVLIPLAFVVILIGSAFLAKRTDLWTRLRQRVLVQRNRHRRRPAYEDVVLVTPPVEHHH